MTSPDRSSTTSSSRRTFLKHSTAAIVGGTLASSLAPRNVHAAGSDILKVGLIGCGGRGNGAAVNAAGADAGVRIAVLADAFEDRVRESRKLLQQQLGEQLTAEPDQCFSGFDAYRRVLESDVDVVLLCTPPHFRPQHLKDAIAAGKHVFCEKPVAVDAPGVRSVLETTDEAQEKGLNIVSGLCWRYDLGLRATVDKIREGAIGDVVAIQENYLTGTLWHRGEDPSWSEMEYQMRNWLYYSWLSGDHIVEQHVHSIDKALWLMGDVPPESCFGLGGRQVRTEEKWGNIYDHFAVCFEWANGVKAFAYTRQMAGCANDVEDYVLGTNGRARLIKHAIEGENDWRYRGPKPSMYDVEHQELFSAIRSGKPINNGRYMSYSTLMAIMGREACYTGQAIPWEEALQSPQRLGPQQYDWGKVDEAAVAMPGIS